MHNMKEAEKLDIIIPIAIELDWPTVESTVSDIVEQNRNYGFTRFALAAPCGGWRSVGYPSKEQYVKLAEFFRQVKTQLEPYGIECGWWNTLTIKSGPSTEFGRMIKADGTETPFSSCPLDPAFRRRFSEDLALFAQIAKPVFLILEDDYSVGASAGNFGCFCKHHLEEFARRQGRYYSREELVEIFAEQTPESHALLKSWRELTRDSLVGLAEAIRREMDKESPEIPIGTMQSGLSNIDGDCAEMVSRALAGSRHIPFSRIFGVKYCGGQSKEIPGEVYNVLYAKQHFKQPFRFYHESDTFPHTGFFVSGSQMKAYMSAAYSFGFDGSTFQTQQLLDDPNEETVYGRMFCKERPRFEAIHQVAKQCEAKGVEICYDPFWNTVNPTKQSVWPLWTQSVSLFGIPFSTVDSAVAFWDERQARYADHDTVMRYLAKGLFLDGEAAKALCERGYGEYLGVEVGENAAEGTLSYDLGAREVICDQFIRESKGRNMPSAHMFCGGKNGKLLKLTVTDPNCEVVSEAYTFQRECICPAMTRLVNKLGGHIVVMGMTLNKNESQSLFNYRRQRLFQELICWCSDSFAFVKEAPNVFLIMNEAVDPNESGFLGMLTLINLCDDSRDTVTLHIPPKWSNAKQFLLLDQDGEWQEFDYTKSETELKINRKLKYCKPMYLLVL